jgi:hypothetical protein
MWRKKVGKNRKEKISTKKGKREKRYKMGEGEI